MAVAKDAGGVGEQERVELVTVIGYYCQISLTLNAFCVPLPEGADDPFPESAP
ncbi:MAG: hypothetical protein ACO3P1_14675 [Pseudomonadales bacterium]